MKESAVKYVKEVFKPKFMDIMALLENENPLRFVDIKQKLHICDRTTNLFLTTARKLKLVKEVPVLTKKGKYGNGYILTDRGKDFITDIKKWDTIFKEEMKKYEEKKNEKT